LIRWEVPVNDILAFSLLVIFQTQVMKYLILSLIAFSLFQCSPKLAPDASWGYQRWVLVEMKGVPVQQSGGRRDAFLNFNISEKRFSGNGGCNQVNGTYTVNSNDIQFVDVISTKMACEDIEFENTFLTTLASVNRYEVRGNDLLLKRKRETVLVLRSRAN
jgi:heat shock protein HslJ